MMDTATLLSSWAVAMGVPARDAHQYLLPDKITNAVLNSLLSPEKPTGEKGALVCF